MLDMLATTASEAIQWSSLGLKPGIPITSEPFEVFGFTIGPITLKYYSLAYLAGIIFAYWHLSKMIKQPGAPMGQLHVDDLFFYCTLGVIIGGRLGYATFYDPSLWTTFQPDSFVSWRVLRMWDGGMSFHGGLIGVVAAIGWVSWRGGLPFLRVCDYISVNVGLGMMLGRLANFINGELWGRPVESAVAWAMVFPTGGEVARHPSQLYQAAGEGLLVLAVMLSLFWLTRARFRAGLMVGVFTVLIAVARFTVEFFRQPDAQLTDFAIRTGLSMGQWLTIPLILLGIALIVWALTRRELASGKSDSATKPASKGASAEIDTPEIDKGAA